jgi:hypothetical protein
VEGDCGAWVVDAATGDIFGHIVAGRPGSHQAYIIPAYKVMADIAKTTGINPVIPCRQDSSFASHSASVHMEALNDFQLGVDLEDDGFDDEINSLKDKARRSRFRSKVSSLPSDTAVEFRLTRGAEEDTVGIFKSIEVFVHYRKTAQDNQKTYVVSNETSP